MPAYIVLGNVSIALMSQVSEMDGEMMVPVYMGYSGKEGKKEKKSAAKGGEYDAKTNKVLRELGIIPPDDDEMDELFRRISPDAYSGRGLERSLGNAPNYMMPPSMTGRMPAYSPMGMMPGMQPGQMAGPQLGPQQGMQAGYGNASQINIQYTSPDGTMYQMGVTAPAENRGKALYNVLSGLYGLMNAEGKSGKYGKGGGKSGGKGYSGGKGGGK
ncbi:hypothetical protein ACFL3V_03775 [Nanoarchaeota archaeon]